VVACLEEWGFAAVSLELASMGTPPLGDLHSDAGRVRTILDCLTAPAVLCGHSYGGTVITEAAAGPHPMVGQLVYLVGSVPDTGQSTADLAPSTSHEFLHRSPQVVELPTGHCPNWSQPQLVAALLGAQIEQLAA
jgi:hypothetical protein